MRNSFESPSQKHQIKKNLDKTALCLTKKSANFVNVGASVLSALIPLRPKVSMTELSPRATGECPLELSTADISDEASTPSAVKQESPIPEDSDVTIVDEKIATQCQQRITSRFLIESMISGVLSATDSSKRKIVDLAMEALMQQLCKNPEGVQKLFENPRCSIDFPVSLTLPPSQVVELIAEYDHDNSLTKVKERLFGNRPPTMRENEVRESVLFKRIPAPNMSRLLMLLGQDLVQEATYGDIVHARNLPEMPKDTAAYKQVADQLRPVWENLRDKNKDFHIKLQRCRLCSFKSESLLVLANHKQMLHFDGRQYECAYCEVKQCSREWMQNHYLNEHSIKALEPEEPPKNACPCCPEEFMRKNARDQHLRVCKREYLKSRTLLQPIFPDHFNFINRWLWDRTQQDVAVSSIDAIKRMSMQMHRQLSLKQTVGSNNVTFMLQMNNGIQRPQSNLKSIQASQARLFNSTQSHKLRKLMPSSARSSKQQHLEHVDKASSSFTNTVTYACEICDQRMDSKDYYITHLRASHKQLLHKSVREIEQGAPLTCSRCRDRFWTYDGLERHLVMSHGLVTNGLLAKAQKKDDAGKCKYCGKQYAFNVLQHLVSDHGVKLCSAEIMYSCDVCAFKCSNYEELAMHLQTQHSGTTFEKSKEKQVNDKAAEQRIQEMMRQQQIREQQRRLKGKRHSGVKRLSGSSTDASAPKRLCTVKYTCSPCDMKFEKYKNVIAHWQRCHLQPCQVSLCRIDCCPLHREKALRDYNFEYLFPEEERIIVLD